MSEPNNNSFLSGDKALWLRLKKFKDKEAFLRAYDSYAEDIYRFLYFKIGNDEEAKDLTSATFVKAWGVVQSGNLNDKDDYKSLRAFIYKIARNQAIDYYRQKKMANFSSLSSVEDEDLDWPDNNQDPDHLANKIDNDLILAKINQLKPEYGNVLILYFVNELSIAEIALILNKNKGNVRVLIFRALEALRSMTKDE